MTGTPVLIAGGGPTDSPTTIAANGDRIPGEFLGFWQRVDGRRVRRARDACQRLLRFDPIPDTRTYARSCTVITTPIRSPRRSSMRCTSREGRTRGVGCSTRRSRTASIR